MKLRELETALQSVREFDDPKVQLEQYPTRPHLAAAMLHTIENTFESFEEKTVIDLGCGTGVLSTGCALLECHYVLGVDIDPDCLTVAKENVDSLELSSQIDFVCSDVRLLKETSRLKSDVVVMNPPFGTKAKHADQSFLKAAFCIARESVYSLHKTSTRGYIEKLADRDARVRVSQVVAEMRYNLPASFAFHCSENKDIAVDFWRFEIQEEV